MIKKQIIHQSKWSFIDQLLMQVINFASNVLLIRLLVPESFGAYVTPFIVFSLARTLQDFGTGSIVYTLKEIPEALKKEILGFNILTTLVIGLILIIFTPSLVFHWTNSFISKDIMFWLSVSYFFTIPHVVHDNFLKHRMEFKKLFFVNVTITLFSTIIGVFFAYNGAEAFSLVYKHLAFIILGSGLYLLAYNQIIIPQFDFTTLNNNKNFSIPLITTQIMGFLSRNIDNLLIHKFIGEYTLGIYERAYRFLTLPIDQISGTVSRVLLPSLSQVNDDLNYQKKLLRATIQITFVTTLPLASTLVIFTEEFVNIVFGQQWINMIPILRVFSILIIFQTLTPLLYNLFLVKNRTKTLMKLNFFSQPVYLIGFITFTYFYPSILNLSIFYACFSIIFSFIFWHLSLNLINENLWFVFASIKTVLPQVTLLITFLALNKNLFFSHQNYIALFIIWLITLLIYFTYIVKSNILVKSLFLEVIQQIKSSKNKY